MYIITVTGISMCVYNVHYNLQNALCVCGAGVFWCSYITGQSLTESKIVMFDTTQKLWTNCFAIVVVF